MSEEDECHPLNVPGEFYVNTACIECGFCRTVAPTIFERDAERGMSYVFKQPENEEEFAQCLESLVGCPHKAIHSDCDLFE